MRIFRVSTDDKRDKWINMLQAISSFYAERMTKGKRSNSKNGGKAATPPPSRPAPGGTAVKAVSEYGTAIWAFEGQNEGDLVLQENDRIKMYEDCGDGWSRGMNIET